MLAEIKAYLRQNISQEQMQQSMRKQHEDNIEAYKAENADCEKFVKIKAPKCRNGSLPVKESSRFCLG